MTTYVRILATREKTRVLVSLGADEVLRASLPPLWMVKHPQAVTRLLEGVALWGDGRACVALAADDAESCYRLGLTDELGVGARGVFYAVEVVPSRRRRRTRLGGVEDFRKVRQLQLVALPGGEQ